MIIQVDQEGNRAIQQLCDIALKSAGMKNLNPVNMILRSVKVLPAPEIEEKFHPDRGPGQAGVEESKKELEEESKESKEETPEEVVE